METQIQTQTSDLKANWAYRGRGFANLLHMGHCAPTAMRTLLDVSALDAEWLVRLSAGMPGGIGNTGHECGAFTSPLVLMGIRLGLRAVNGDRAADGELPVIFERGHVLQQDFLACHKTLQCKEIRGKDKFPLHCIAPVLRSAELYQHALSDGDAAPTRRAPTRRLPSRRAPGKRIRVCTPTCWRLNSTAPKRCCCSSAIRHPKARRCSTPSRRSSAGRCSWARPAAPSPPA